MVNSGVLVGRVTHVYANLRCVAIKVKRNSIAKGDKLRFVKGEPDKEMPGSYRGTHYIDSIEINHRPVSLAKRGQHCAVRIPYGQLPPNNAEVVLLPQD